MKIVILDGYAENPGDLSWDGFRDLGETRIYDRSPLDDAQEVIRRIGDAQAVITNKIPITREVLEAAPGIRYIGVLATGYNVVDTAAAKEKGIPVTNIPSYGTQAVAQFAIALLLEICSRVGHHDRAVHEGRWQSSPDFCFWDYPLVSLAGKTIGILGFGSIGQAAAGIAKAMGMRVLAYSRKPPEGGHAFAEYVTMDELFAQSDVISLHLPLTAQTEGLICSRSIAKMKDGVILINTARGGLINERDLYNALESGKVFGAGLDVVSTEPIKADNILLRAKNCIITPHIAWASKESRQRLMEIAVQNLAAFLQGSPENVVNG